MFSTARPPSHAGGGLKTRHVHDPREPKHFTPLECGAVCSQSSTIFKTKKGAKTSQCASAHFAQWERSRRYTRRPRVRVPVWPFFHCPLPTAHCPLPTAHLQTADRSGKLGKVESLMSRRQNATSAVNRTVCRSSRQKCEHIGAQHCGQGWRP